MIYFLTTRKHSYTMEICLETDGKALKNCVRQMNYSSLFLKSKLPRGVYIFADIERLSQRDLQRAMHVWNRLERDGQSILLNQPNRVMKRFQLLSSLHACGINTFRAFRLKDIQAESMPCSFPVFIRGENDHKGATTLLLNNAAELRCELEKIDRTWRGRKGRIVTEFCDVSDTNGIYRKYSAFCIAGKIYPRHIFFRNDWLVKAWERLDPELLEEEVHFMDTNPHAADLEPIFRLANIDFGRIDYGVLEGKIQVWEINTNPMLLANYGGGGPARQPLHDRFHETFIKAFQALNTQADDIGGEVILHRPAVSPWMSVRLPVEVAYRKVFSSD